MHLFLENRSASPYGIRFSAQNYSIYEKIKSYLLYSVAKIIFDTNDILREALIYLVE